MSELFTTIFTLAALVFPLFAHAHEVYVLPPETVQAALKAPAFSEWSALIANFGEFALWAFIAALVVFIVFFVSISRSLERRLDPFLARLRRYAPVASRITAGLAFLACAHYQALFGPELPLSQVFGPYADLATAALIAVGVLVLLGLWTRLAALLIFCLFCAAAAKYGWYLFTYTNYLGEIIVLMILGAHRVGVHAHAGRAGRGLSGRLGRIADALAPYSMLILRVAFGISLLYAALYAKFIHNNLALDVASLPLAGHATSLAATLGFEPHFLVLGAGIVEVVIGLFFLLGIEIRFTALFLEFWLTLSLLYFGEVVWPHLILIGIPIAFLLYGYDRYSLEGHFFKRGKREPVL